MCISETFLFNVKSRRNQAVVSELLKGYYNNTAEKKEKEKAINKIFPAKKFGLQKWSKQIVAPVMKEPKPPQHKVNLSETNTMEQIYQKYKGCSNKSLYDRQQVKQD